MFCIVCARSTNLTLSDNKSHLFSIVYEKAKPISVVVVVFAMHIMQKKSIVELVLDRIDLVSVPVLIGWLHPKCRTCLQKEINLYETKLASK